MCYPKRGVAAFLYLIVKDYENWCNWCDKGNFEEETFLL